MKKLLPFAKDTTGGKVVRLTLAVTIAAVAIAVIFAQKGKDDVVLVDVASDEA